MGSNNVPDHANTDLYTCGICQDRTAWWRMEAVEMRMDPSEKIEAPSTLKLFVYWILGIGIVYSALFAVGALILH